MTHSAGDDIGLLSRLRSGDRDAMRELHRRHVVPVYRAVRAHLLDRNATDDAVQDVFFLLWEKRQSIRVVGSSALPWLLVTAKYSVMNANRLQARRSHLPFEEVDAGAVAVDSAADAHVERRMLLSAVAAAVHELPELDRRVYEACIVKGLSYDEAAALLGATRGAVRNRLSRVRARIRDDLRVRSAR